MAIIQDGQKKLLKEFDERRKREFLVVTPQVSKKSTVISVKPGEQRAESWINTFKNNSIPVTDWNVEDNGVVVFRFNNGLKISDYGYHISFSATEDKDKVNMNSAIKIVACAAQHLYHSGWKDFDVAALREGGLTFLSAFSHVYTSSPKAVVNNLRIRSLKGIGSK